MDCLRLMASAERSASKLATTENFEREALKYLDSLANEQNVSKQLRHKRIVKVH
jgi:hypothetical protein